MYNSNILKNIKKSKGQKISRIFVKINFWSTFTCNVMIESNITRTIAIKTDEKNNNIFLGIEAMSVDILRLGKMLI